MVKKKAREKFRCEFYTWCIYRRVGVYWADGRGNQANLDRYSLGTRDRAKAIAELRLLDRVQAANNGLIEKEQARDNSRFLPLKEGWDLFIQHVGRPPVQGGATLTTVKRYGTVFKKFHDFAKSEGLNFWQQIGKSVLDKYGRWLHKEDYHGKTQYTELTVLKQVLNWLIEENLIPSACGFRLPLRKPMGTNTYCYSKEEVQAIILFCNQTPGCTWLVGPIIGLAMTGLRIGELSDLRWSDINPKSGYLTLSDNTLGSRQSERETARSTKSHRSRTLPIHPDLKEALALLPKLADGRIFHGPRNGRLKPSTVLNVFKRVVIPAMKRKFGVANGGIGNGRIHSFRHFFCSNCAQEGVPLTTLMRWLGHRDSQMVLHYYHQNDQISGKLMESLPSLTGGLTVPLGAIKEGESTIDPERVIAVDSSVVSG